MCRGWGYSGCLLSGWRIPLWRRLKASLNLLLNPPKDTFSMCNLMSKSSNSSNTNKPFTLLLRSVSKRTVRYPISSTTHSKRFFMNNKNTISASHLRTFSFNSPPSIIPKWLPKVRNNIHYNQLKILFRRINTLSCLESLHRNRTLLESLRLSSQNGYYLKDFNWIHWRCSRNWSIRWESKSVTISWKGLIKC